MDARAYMVVLVGLAAVVEDLRSRRIPNWVSVGALGSGLVIQGWMRGWSGLGQSLAGAAIGFCVFLIFYVLGGMGGGDIKLMAGFGALLGSGLILKAALMAAIVGALFALLYLSVRGVIRKVRGEAGQSQAGKERESMPYAPAITVGAWLAMASDL